MAAVWMRFRSSLRGSWRGTLALALLVGIAGGAVMASLAGARRTDSAFDRLVAETEAWDVLINPDLGSDSRLDMDDVAALAQVADAGRVDGLFLAPGGAGSFDELLSFDQTIALGGDLGYGFGRLRLSEGRAPMRNRPHEVAIDPRLAEERGWRVGDRVRLLNVRFEDIPALDQTDLSAAAFGELLRSGAIGEDLTVTITGIGVGPEQIVVDEGFEASRMFLSPAFLDAHPDSFVAYWGGLVRLRNGAADLPAFRRGVEALVPGEAIAFQTLEKTLAKADRAVRPSVGALTIFAVVVALTGLLVVGQSFARQIALDATDDGALRALGMTRRGLFATAMLRAAVVAVVGAAIAVALAVLASPLTPIGVAREAEPHPGLAYDVVVLGLGVAAIALVALALAAVPAWRVARARPDGADGARPSRIVAAVAGSGLSVSAAAGVRMALEPGRGRTAVPVRVTMASASLAVAALVAAGVFASSLDHLVSTPRLFGWNWDAQLSVNAEQVVENDDGTVQVVSVEGVRDAAVDVLDSARAVDRWGTVSVSDVALGGESVPSVGIDGATGAVVPTLVDGSLPTRDGEVALGTLTKRRLGIGTGDVVRARSLEGETVPLRVVGTVVLPGLGTYEGADKTALGEGAVLTRDALYRLGPDFGRDDFVVQFASSATPDEREAVIGRVAEVTTAYDPEAFAATGVQRPADIISYDRVRSTPVVLAVVLALLAATTVAHALVSAVRRRRRELAMLVTLGFTRRQVSATVAWQATTFGLVALAVGVPLGIVAGRWAWGWLADDLGTVSEPRVPFLALAVGVAVALLLCNVVAYVPGRMAARIRPAVALRSE